MEEENSKKEVIENESKEERKEKTEVQEKNEDAEKKVNENNKVSEKKQSESTDAVEDTENGIEISNDVIAVIAGVAVSEVQAIDENYTKQDVLKYFAMGEKNSNHPIAKSILKKYSKLVSQDDNKILNKDNNEQENLKTENVENFEEVSGKGIQYQYEGKTIKIGNTEFTNADKENIVGTVLFIQRLRQSAG